MAIVPAREDLSAFSNGGLLSLVLAVATDALVVDLTGLHCRDGLEPLNMSR